QRVRRAAVADGQVRGHLPAGLRDGAGVGPRAEHLPAVLQPRAAAFVVGVPNAGGGLQRGATEDQTPDGGVMTKTGGRDYSDRSASRGTENGYRLTIRFSCETNMTQSSTFCSR